MSNNQPEFDPLNPTKEEEADMARGYLDGFRGAPPPSITSVAYDHGRRNGANDKAGTVDPEQRELARRRAQLQKDHQQPEAPGQLRPL